MAAVETRLSSRNGFKLGLFSPNCSNGLTMTKAPVRWTASWDNNVKAAQLADAAGLEFVLPVGRWKGYRGETNTQGEAFETITWATGLLGATRDIAVFGTLHMALIHPVFAAKQIATADHVGKGRFGLNVVAGWNESEFDMFGAELLPHDERYAFAEEWVTICKRIWSEAEPFDFAGRYFNLKEVQGMPKPYNGRTPLIMSAGSSRAGRDFAIRHVDCLFMIIDTLDKLPADVAAMRAVAGRPVRVFASSHMVCRPTRKEAEDFYHYVVDEMGDWAAAEYAAKAREQGQSLPKERLQQIKRRFVGGCGTYAIIGSYDDVADEFARGSAAGLEGMAVGLVNYIDDFAGLRDEVLPRLERLGLRQPFAGSPPVN
jgi:alkanesulfonate monooxygenase SsuD/methylene tetrahydromethanopterin reductase-like flavin-dependent oxidoreductase (luciferase family)